MSWKQRLFKPKWQNKNADIRLQSVSSEQHPDLIGSLMDIASSDQDSRVRIAAIKRLHQLENILTIYDKEQHPEVKAVLEDRIRQLAAATNESRPPLAQRMRVIAMTGNRELIEHLARNAPEAELRRAAIEKVTRQGVLGDCSIEDNDAEIRSFAAGRITQHKTLKRVIDGLRKRDKTLYGQLQQRLHQELLAEGDSDEINIEALKICVELEKLALDMKADHSAEIDGLNAEWKALGAKISTSISDRHQRVMQRLSAPPAGDKTIEAPQPAATKPSEEEPVKTVDIVEKLPRANDALARIATDICLYETKHESHFRQVSVSKLRNQLEKAWQRCVPPHPDDQACWETANTALNEMQASLDAQKQELEKRLEHATTLLTQMETELENGELHKALETRAKIQQAARENGNERAWKQVNSKMAGMHARLRELRDWHHWSNNKIRKRLIAEMEVLPAADLHPDALLDRVKSLQMEWKALEASEQIPGEKKFMAAPWMWRKFSEAGNKAFDTAKPFLDKRTEIQDRLVQSMQEFCNELDELVNAGNTDLAALNKGLNDARKRLRELGDLPFKQRQKIAKRLKSALDKGNELVQANFETIEREKMKLIRSASQLVHMPERSEAIALAKSLQSSWKATGRLWRSRDQELWNQFREHLDPLFSELQEEQASIKAADDERLAAQKDLCKQLKAIVNDTEDLPSLQGKVQGLQDDWKDIEHPDRKLQQQFQLLVDEYHKKLENEQSRQVETDRKRWWQKAGLLHELTVNGRTTKGKISKKAETSINAAWPQHSSDEPVEVLLDKALDDILEGTLLPPAEDDLKSMLSQARLLCISLEFIAGLPSPEEDREQRMKYQVDRLAESMSGESPRQSASEEAREAEKTWLTMYALPDADFKAFGDRVNQAMTAIFGSD